MKQVADAMLNAVIEVVNQNSSSSLQSVRIVIFQAPMLQDFYSSMQERQASSSKQNAILQTVSNAFKGFRGEIK